MSNNNFDKLDFEKAGQKPREKKVPLMVDDLQVAFITGMVAILMEEHNPKFDKMIIESGDRGESFSELLTEIGKVVHDNNWCKDPNCKVRKYLKN